MFIDENTTLYIADAVLAGGIRRAALISLFSADDEEMLELVEMEVRELLDEYDVEPIGTRARRDIRKPIQARGVHQRVRELPQSQIS